MKKTFIMILATVLSLAWSCSQFDEAHMTDVKELAWNSKQVGTVSADGGEMKIPVYSSGNVKVSFTEDADWIEVDRCSFNGDSEITVNLLANEGFRRMARLVIELEGTEVNDTVVIRQEGVKAYLECNAPYMAVSGAEDADIEFDLTTNLPCTELECSVEYVSGSEGWVDAPQMSDYSLTKAFLNTSSAVNGSEGVRKAKILLSHIDGWGEKLTCELYITQSGSDGGFGEVITFEQARALGTLEGTVVNKDLIINGIVVSDCRSRNMEENVNISHDVVDSLQSLRTAYVVSEDGQLGFRLRFSTAEENVLMQGTALSLNLNGTVITREENPERYTISNIGGASMVGSEAGVQIPVKVKTIASLNDSDLYTYVSLQNTEFIFKYGTYADVYENYTLKSALHENPVNPNNNGRMDGWATLLVDADGKAIYAPVNMLCLWRRNPVPQGVGPTNGIIVHNKLPKVGNVGRYQIRVLDRNGFAQAEEGSSYEQYCIWNGKGKYIHSAYSNRNARYNHNQSKPTESIIPSSDILEFDVPEDREATPLWPKGELFLENRISTNGAWPMNNGEYYCRHRLEDLGTIGENPGVQPLQGESETYYAFSAIVNVKGWYNFDASGNVKLMEDGSADSNGIRYELSTKDLSGNGLLFSYDLAAGTIAISTSKTFPAHWCLEYSVDGGETYEYAHDLVTGEKYVHLRSLPWWDGTVNGTLYKTCAAAGLGFAQHAVLLPAEVLGKEMLKVRLRPYDTKITTLPIAWDGDNETAEILHSTSASNYFKIGSAKFSVLK